MRLIIVRHGKTKEGKKGILLGCLPGKLSGNGKMEMLKISKKIKALNFSPEFIISSDLKRARESAVILSKKLSLPVKYEKLLRERGGGKAEGKSEKEIDWESYEKKPIETRKHPGGESFEETRKRAKRFLNKIKKFKAKNIIIVSHNAFILMLLSAINNWPIKKSLKYKLPDMVIKNIKF